MIKIKDKTFELFISNKEIKLKTNKIVKSLQECYVDKNPIFFIILDGAFVFGADVFQKCKIKNSEVEFMKLKSYDGLENTGSLKTILKSNKQIKNRNVIIIEDIVDSGFTINHIVKMFKKENAKTIEVVSLLYKPNNYNYNHNIKWYGFEIPNDFVIGYGLDYNGIGRELNEIYKLKIKT